ncbi:hypothetical protein LQW54_005029 [Pestalotiopsis sp. IQ-011]
MHQFDIYISVRFADGFSAFESPIGTIVGGFPAGPDVTELYNLQGLSSPRNGAEEPVKGYSLELPYMRR